MMNDKDIVRFYSKINTTGECWEWDGWRDEDGYGCFKVGGRMRRATRLMWELTNGYPPNDKFVMHTCDNPACVRPNHLVLGTPADNSADMVAKRRSASGTRASRSRLTADQALAIRNASAIGVAKKELARRYGVSDTAIRKIVSGENWRYIEGGSRWHSDQKNI